MNINAASSEQDAGADQIAKSIQQLDAVIQQNAASSEEMASTAEELNSQSEQLQDMIGFFNVGTVTHGFGTLGVQPATVKGVQRKQALPRPELRHSAASGVGRKGEAAALKFNPKDALDEDFEAY